MYVLTGDNEELKALARRSGFVKGFMHEALVANQAAYYPEAFRRRRRTSGFRYPLEVGRTKKFVTTARGSKQVLVVTAKEKLRAKRWVKLPKGLSSLDLGETDAAQLRVNMRQAADSLLKAFNDANSMLTSKSSYMSAVDRTAAMVRLTKFRTDLTSIQVSVEQASDASLPTVQSRLEQLRLDFFNWRQGVTAKTGAFGTASTRPLFPKTSIAKMPGDSSLWVSIYDWPSMQLVRLYDRMAGTNYEANWRQQMNWEAKLEELKGKDPNNPSIAEYERLIKGGRAALESAPGFKEFFVNVADETRKQAGAMVSGLGAAVPVLAGLIILALVLR